MRVNNIFVFCGPPTHFTAACMQLRRCRPFNISLTGLKYVLAFNTVLSPSFRPEAHACQKYRVLPSINTFHCGLRRCRPFRLTCACLLYRPHIYRGWRCMRVNNIFMFYRPPTHFTVACMQLRRCRLFSISLPACFLVEEIGC